MGSPIAEELANSGVGHLKMIDGDVLEEVNLVRHSLSREYLGVNKAEGMRLHLSKEVPTLQAEAAPFYIDNRINDVAVDDLLREADLVIAATGDDEVQRRIARRALALDIPALFPALYVMEGGEVFIQRSPQLPCFLCWDASRPASEPLHAVTALKVDAFGITQLSVYLSLGILDGESSYAELFRPPRNDARPRQLFIQNQFGLAMQAVEFRRDCPACQVGPAGGNATLPRQPRPWVEQHPSSRARTSQVPVANRGQSRTDSNMDPVAKAAVVGLLAVAALAIVAIAGHNEKVNTAPLVNTPHGSSTQPRNQLPQRAAMTTVIKPRFHANASTVRMAVRSYDTKAIIQRIAMKPRLHGFELHLGIVVRSTSAAYKESEATSSQEISYYCLQEGEEATIAPLRTNLHQTGSVVSGELIYPAVLPGAYSLAQVCIDASGANERNPIVGTVDLPSVGEASLTEGGVAIYEARRSKTNTVLVFGAISSWEYKDQLSLRQSCISNMNRYNYERSTVHPDKVKYQEFERGSEKTVDYGDSYSGFSIGAASYPVSMADTYQATFFGDCGAGSYISLKRTPR